MKEVFEVVIVTSPDHVGGDATATVAAVVVVGGADFLAGCASGRIDSLRVCGRLSTTARADLSRGADSAGDQSSV